MGRKENAMEQQDVFDAATLGLDDDFLPDGWDGKTDIFMENGELNEAAFASDGEQDADELPLENEDGSAEDADVPTTDDDADDAQDQNADEETDSHADERSEQEVKPSRKLKLKVNHKEEEVDIDAMSDDDLVAWLQKGRAFDSMKDAENKRRYREVYQEQLDAGMTESVAQIVAQNAVGGKTYSLEDEAEAPEEKPETAQPSPAPAHTPTIRDFASEVAQLRALYPDFKETPDEVAKAVAKGVPLLSAYLAYRDKESSKTAAALKRENAVLKQNAAAAAKAPVKGVTGGGKSTPEKKDPFAEGFDEALEGW
jgi:hypothetical protein